MNEEEDRERTLDELIEAWEEGDHPLSFSSEEMCMLYDHWRDEAAMFRLEHQRGS